MFSHNRLQSYTISDNDLDLVSGGNTSILDEQGLELKEGRFITSSPLTGYSSGSEPKFSVGNTVKIKWRISADLTVMCNAEVTAVSEVPDGGLLFRKFTYAVKILTCPNSDMLGMIETGVHENCLFL